MTCPKAASDQDPTHRVPAMLDSNDFCIISLFSPTVREIIAQLEDAPAEWEVKNDLLLLKQLALVDTNGHGRVAYWFLVNQ